EGPLTGRLEPRPQVDGVRIDGVGLLLFPGPANRLQGAAEVVQVQEALLGLDAREVHFPKQGDGFGGAFLSQVEDSKGVGGRLSPPPGPVYRRSSLQAPVPPENSSMSSSASAESPSARHSLVMGNSLVGKPFGPPTPQDGRRSVGLGQPQREDKSSAAIS